MSLLMSSVSRLGTPLTLATAQSGGHTVNDKILGLLPDLSFGLTADEMGAEPHQSLRVVLNPVVSDRKAFSDLGMTDEQRDALAAFIETKGSRIDEALLDALIERKHKLREVVKAVWESLTPTPDRVELVQAKLQEAVAESDRSVLTDEEISRILTDLGRVNLSRDRGPEGPMPLQIQQFRRGYSRTSELLHRLDISPEQLREAPHLAYRAAPVVTDLDGTSWDTTYHWGVAPAGLKHFLNRTGWSWIQQHIARFFPFSISLFDSEFTLYTMWRVGWIDYLVGVCHALKGAYPVDTKGWSRRPAALSYHDAAVRVIFMGPDYDIEEAERRAQASMAEEGGEQQWESLEPNVQQQLVIDEIEKDLLSRSSFISTVHISEVVTGLVEKFAGGLKQWQQNPWTSDELRRLRHVFSRPWKDMLLPTGYNIHVGSKTPIWARAAGKLAVAEALEHRGLLDDGLKHIEPLVQAGGRGIHIPEGRELLLRLPKVGAIETLLGTIYVNGRQTETIINNVEEDFDPEKGGKRVVVPGPSRLRIYDDPKGLMTPLRMNIAAISTKNPTETAPVELNFSDISIDLKHPVEQYYGYRWEMEERTVNVLRHNVPQKKFSWDQRARIGLYSGLGLAMAHTVPQTYTMFEHARFDPHDLAQFAIIMAFGMTNEMLFYRTILGNVVHAHVGSFMMMTGILTALQVAHPNLSMSLSQLGQNVFMGLAFAVMDTVVQRTVIPALLLAYGRRAVTHLQGKNLKQAARAVRRGRTNAKLTSAASAIAFFSILKFLYGGP